MNLLATGNHNCNCCTRRHQDHQLRLHSSIQDTNPPSFVPSKHYSRNHSIRTNEICLAPSIDQISRNTTVYHPVGGIDSWIMNQRKNTTVRALYISFQELTSKIIFLDMWINKRRHDMFLLFVFYNFSHSNTSNTSLQLSCLLTLPIICSLLHYITLRLSSHPRLISCHLSFQTTCQCRRMSMSKSHYHRTLFRGLRT